MDKKARKGRLRRRRKDERRERKKKMEVSRRAKKRSEGPRLERRLREGGVAGAAAVRERKDGTAAQRLHDPATLWAVGTTQEALFQPSLKKYTESGKEIKKEIWTEIRREREEERGKERGKEGDNKVIPAAVEEMTE